MLGSGLDLEIYLEGTDLTNDSLHLTKPLVTHRAGARSAPTDFAGEANVRNTWGMQNSHLMIRRLIVAKRGLCSLLYLLLVTIILPGVLGCSDDESQISIPNVVDDPWAISLTRTDWFWASSPFFGSEYLANNPDLRTFDPQDRVEAVRWFIPRERTLR